MSYYSDNSAYGGYDNSTAVVNKVETPKKFSFLGTSIQKVGNVWKKIVQKPSKNSYELTMVDHLEQVDSKLHDEGIKDEYHSVLPAANQLQIDIDLEELPPDFMRRVDILVKAMNGPVGMTTYRSRHGRRHVVLDCPKDFSEHERIAWQAVLGSDQMREAMCLLSLAKGIKNGVLLIQRKDGSDKLDSVLLEPTVRKFR